MTPLLSRLISKASAPCRMVEYQLLLAKARQVVREGASGRGMGFFIVSSGRSGSTLLRRMLHAHPLISIPPESEDLVVRSMKAFPKAHGQVEAIIESQLEVVRSMECMRSWALDMDHLAEAWRGVLRAGQGFPEFHTAIYQSYADHHKPGASLHGDKTPLLVWYMDLLHILHPKALFIFLVRHPLDMISSMASMEVHGKDLNLATARWIGAADLLLGVDKRNYGPQVLPVRYEDLVAAPEATLQKICHALHVELLPGMVNDVSHDLGDTFHAHHAAVKRPVNQEAIGSWKKRITLQQAEAIMAQCGDRAQRLGYTL